MTFDLPPGQTACREVRMTRPLWIPALTIAAVLGVSESAYAQEMRPDVTSDGVLIGAGTGAAAFPAGFEPKPSPYNVSFTGTACSEPKLIELAYAFEQATKKRIPPPQFP